MMGSDEFKTLQYISCIESISKSALLLSCGISKISFLKSSRLSNLTHRSLCTIDAIDKNAYTAVRLIDVERETLTVHMSTNA